MKTTKHFIERMLERNITQAMVMEALKSHKLLPGNTPNEIKVVGKRATLVVSKTQELLTCYPTK